MNSSALSPNDARMLIGGGVGVVLYVLLTAMALAYAESLGPMLFASELNKPLWLVLGPLPYIINAHGIVAYLAFSLVLLPLFAIAGGTSGRKQVIAVCSAISLWALAGAWGYGF